MASALAVFAVARPSFAGGRPHLSYRQAEIYGAQETLLITQHGFTEGRTIFPAVVTKDGAQPKYADPGRLASLGDFYARIANSDVVRNSSPQLSHVPPGVVVAAPVVSYALGNTYPLPMLTISGVSPVPTQAIGLARLGSDAFRTYLERQQRDAGIPAEQRVLVTVLTRAGRNTVTVLQPRKKTIAIMVFMAIMAATFGVALILENVRPRPSVIEHLPPRDIADHRVPQAQAAGRMGSADGRG